MMPLQSVAVDTSPPEAAVVSAALRRADLDGDGCGTKDMMQTCVIYLHAISLVADVSGSCRWWNLTLTNCRTCRRARPRWRRRRRRW